MRISSIFGRFSSSGETPRDSGNLEYALHVAASMDREGEREREQEIKCEAKN